MAAPLQLPGYVYDSTTKRYYKAPKSTAAAPPSARAFAPPPTSSSGRPESASRQRKRARREKEKGKGRAVDPAPEPNLWGLRDLGIRSTFDGSVGRKERLHHDLRSLSLSRSKTVRSVFPDCLPLDDDITHLSFDELSPSVLRIGGSNGTIATGDLARAADETAFFPNDEEGFRTSWYFPSKITSLQTCGERVLATCLGPPAQALVGTTSDSISLASVTLAPRKTSLWTSALSRDLVALGCDKKVLVTSDPSRPGGQMEGYVTGGNRGDGTVFALDIYENLIFAGTRKGRVQLFDRRSTRPAFFSSSGTGSSLIAKDELNLHLSSSVTHLRHIPSQPYLLLAAGLDGFLGLYDLRFPPRPSPSSRSSSSASSSSAQPTASTSKPLLQLHGHVNSITHGLGLDVWEDEFVVAAGQDARLRLWSLRTGQLLSPSLSASSSAALPSTFRSPSTDSTSSVSALPPGIASAYSSLRTISPSFAPSFASSHSSSFASPFSSSTAPTTTGFEDPPANPFVRQYASPVLAVKFSPLDPVRLGSGDKEYAERAGRRRELKEKGEGEDGLLRWGLPSLWVAEGGKVEGFAAG
ncbi:hypothetical protein JCM8097_009001 [Rhodosporidiobolus ruineniae]